MTTLSLHIYGYSVIFMDIYCISNNPDNQRIPTNNPIPASETCGTGIRLAICVSTAHFAGQ